MRAIDCKAVCEEIDDLDLGQEPSALALIHLRKCSSCRDLYESGSKLREIVSSLGSVEAPADFDFRLRARLAHEKARSAHRFGFGKLSFGFPSAVVVVLLLLAGGVLVLRGLKPPSNGPSAQTERKISSAAPALTKNGLAEVAKARPLEGKAGPQNRSSNVPRKADAVRRPRIRSAAEEFSSSTAPVVRREDSMANAGAPLVFPIPMPYQSLKLSLDDGSGVSRTISFPTVSFGSQRFLKPGASSRQPSAKGIW